MKLVMDVVINHSSDEHDWFKKSILGIEPYTDYYVWKDPTYNYESEDVAGEPNDWYSVFGGSAWEWREERKQFYLHNFGKFQPDLNLTNPRVVKEIHKIFDFWIKRGVDGFRLDAPPWYIEDFDCGEDTMTCTMNRPETYVFIHELRTYIDEHYNQNYLSQEKILIAESVQDVSFNMAYYGNKTFPVTHYPFNFDFEFIASFIDAYMMDEMIQNWLPKIPKGSVVNWVSESHDMLRATDRLNSQFSDITIIMTMLLPGAVSVYYGQEIGMFTNAMKLSEIGDEMRNLVRTPMQWNDSPQAGFSTNKKTWLPVNPNYYSINVEKLKAQPESRYNLFKNLSEVRQTDTIMFRNFESYILPPWVYIFTRRLVDHESYIVLVNLNSEMELVELPLVIPDVPTFLFVVTSSINSYYHKGDRIRVKPFEKYKISMPPLSCIVCKDMMN